MKKIAILYSKYTPAIDAIKYNLKEYEIHTFEEPCEEVKNSDLIVLSEYYKEYKGNALAVHHSLLPAFLGEEPEKQALMAGVKVTGITIYFTKTKQIVAQYPIFITNDMHYEELKQELTYLEQTIFPLVIQKIVQNEPFEIRALLNGSCSGKCGGCSRCSK